MRARMISAAPGAVYGWEQARARESVDRCRRCEVMLAPPRDAALAQLTDRQPLPFDDDLVGAPPGANRPVGEHAVAVDRECMDVERHRRSPCERLLDHCSVRRP